jgi:hypothetical protein
VSGPAVAHVYWARHRDTHSGTETRTGRMWFVGGWPVCLHIPALARISLTGITLSVLIKMWEEEDSPGVPVSLSV